MPKLSYLLARYARPFYRRLALCALAVAVAAGIAAAFGYPEPAAIASSTLTDSLTLSPNGVILPVTSVSTPAISPSRFAV